MLILFWQELYFIPYKYSNGIKLLAKGKLVSKYYSIRKEFKALNIITGNKNQLELDSEDDLRGWSYAVSLFVFCNLIMKKLF